MHYLPDTEDEDAAAERPWPDGFKEVIRRELPPALRKELSATSLRNIYQAGYSNDYNDIDLFVEKTVGLAVIGAEGGADSGFDAIYQAFLDEKPLPETRPYARYLWPHVYSETLKKKIHQAIVEDYRQDEDFLYAYKAGYAQRYPCFDQFIDDAAGLMVSETEKGTDDMLAQVYRAFLAMRTLPPARRRPRRLKQY